MNDMLVYESQKKSGGVAALLNWLIPGVGYFYCASVVGGILALVIGALLSSLTAVTFGLGLPLLGMFYLVVFIDGFLAAGRHNRRLALRIQEISARD